MLKKISLLMGLLVLCLSMMLSGCSAPSDSASKVDEIKKAGKLILGTSADYPPYEFHKQINGKDTIIGFDIEIAKQVAKDMGVEIEIKDMKFDALLVALNSGNVDMVVAGLSPTAERAKSVDFSNIYYKATQGAIIKSDSQIKSIEDLAGKKIGVQRGSLQEEIAKTQVKDANIKSLAKVPDLILELKTGKVDAVILEDVVANSYADRNEDLKVPPIQFEEEEEGSAIAVKKGNTDLAQEINKTIEKLESEAKIDKFVIDAVNNIE